MIQDHESRIKLKEQDLNVAYNRVFQRESPFTHTVLADLAKFCRANESTFHPDSRAHALQEGRREVFLRIQEYMNLTTEELFNYHTMRAGKRR